MCEEVGEEKRSVVKQSPSLYEWLCGLKKGTPERDENARQTDDESKGDTWSSR